MVSADVAAEKFARKLQAANWGQAASNYAAAKPRMTKNYPFGGKMGANYRDRIASAQYRAPDSSEIAQAVRNFRAAAGLT